MNGDCKKCDWYALSIGECARPTCCKVYNEFFKDENKGKLKEGNFYYSFL